METVGLSASIDQEELKRKNIELNQLQQELAEKELTLSTLRREVAIFEHIYNQRVGKKFAELDGLKSDILKLAAKLNPESENFQSQAKSAEEKARKSKENYTFQNEIDPSETADPPSEELKKIFREAAKKIHPDLTTDMEERERRHALMARLNQAYNLLDAEQLNTIVTEFEAGRKPDGNLSFGQKLSHILKQIAQVRHRMNKIEIEIERVQQSEMFRLKVYANECERQGQDVLQDMSNEVDEKIATLKLRIKNLASDCTFI